MKYPLARLRGLARLSAAILAILFTTSIALVAQTTTGSIYGTVTDASGAVIPGATITVTNPQTNETLTAKSNNDGAFVFPVVNPGTYKATATMAGFSTVTQTDLRVASNQNVNSSFTLSAGEVNSEVTVTAGAALIDTRESQIAETVDQKRIVDLPLSTRNAYDLVTLVPGITQYAAGAQIGDNGGTQFSTNGTRPNFNSFYLDGAYNTSFFRGGGNIVPAPDALEQFRIITSNFDAEFGRYPGAVVNTITRSGSNKWHGVAYDYLRNAIFNGRNYFTQAGTARAQFIYNVFGGGVGGPAIHDKLFFFLSYQGTRIRQVTTINPGAIVVPTDLERAGNFTASSVKPNTSICPGFICPTDPVTQNILKYVPRADPSQTTFTSGGAPIAHPAQQQLPNPVIGDQGVGRITWNMNAAHALSFTYFNSQGKGFNRTAGSNQLLAYSGNSTYAGQSNYVLTDRWIISPHAVNTATAFYTLNKTVAGNVYNTALLSDLGASFKDGGPVITQPQFSITGYFSGGTGGSGANTQAQMTTGIEDTMNYTRGNHEMKFGGSFIFNKYHETATFQSSSIWAFTNSQTGNALADFITGRMNQFRQNSGARHRLHAWDPSLFAQDNWRLTRRLTANLGVRWEVYYPFSGEKNLGTFQAGVQSTRFPTAPLGLLAEGDPGVPEGVLKTSYTKFAPRVGFAMDVFGDGKTSLRGGYGIFYSFSQETFVGNLEQQPFTLAVSILNTKVSNPFAGSAFPTSPFPYQVNLQNPQFTTGAIFSGIPKDESAVPYLQQYNLTLEQQYGNDWNSRISYIGNVGRHFYIARDQNAPVYIPGNCPAASNTPCSSTAAANIASRRPLNAQGYSSNIGLLDPSSNSAYNSLQTTITRRLKNNFSFQAFYVWSRAIDNLSADPGSATAYALVNQYDASLDRGLSSLHVPHRFVASFIYQLPKVKRWGLVGKEVLSGWQVNGIQTLSAGNPFNITSNKDTNFDSITTDRPNQTGNVFLGYGRKHADEILQYFNTAAFTAPGANQPYGNVGRNSIVGPGTIKTDISAFKRFEVYKEANLLFRAEIFNLFNHTNLNNPNGVLGNANFGRITSADAPRIMQFAIKFEF